MAPNLQIDAEATRRARKMDDDSAHVRKNADVGCRFRLHLLRVYKRAPLLLAPAAHLRNFMRPPQFVPTRILAVESRDNRRELNVCRLDVAIEVFDDDTRRTHIFFRRHTSLSVRVDCCRRSDHPYAVAVGYSDHLH